MELTTIAKPYAKALNSLALQNNSYIGWLEFLETLVKVTGDVQFQKFISFPSVTSANKKSFLNSLLEKVISRKLTQQEINFIDLLITNNRIGTSSSILELFSNYSASTVKTINVISAYELTDIEKEKLIADLTEKFNSTIELNIEVNQRLVGGLVIKDGDKVIDLSISARINKLHSCLSIN